MKAYLIWAALVIVVVAAALGSRLKASNAERPIPAAYQEKLRAIETEQSELTKKREDLQRSLAETETQMSFNCSRENTIGGDALREMHLSRAEYQVDVVTMTAKPISH